MKYICHIIQQLNRGGAERFLINYVNNSQLPHKIFLFKKGTLDDELRVPYEIINKPKYLIPFILRKKLIKEAAAVDTLMFSAGFYGRILSPRPIIHQYRTEAFKRKFFKRYYIDKILDKKTDYIIVPSLLIKDYLIKYGFNKEKIKVFYTAVDSKKFHFRERFPKEPLKLVTVSRINKDKNIDKIIEELSKVERKFTYTIIGKGSRKDISKLKKKAEELNIGDKIEFLGEVDHNKLPSLLDNFDIKLLFSKREGLPNSLVEASMSGLICLASNVGGVKEIVDKTVNLNELSDILNSMKFDPYKPDKRKLKKFDLEYSVKKLDIFFQRYFSTWHLTSLGSSSSL